MCACACIHTKACTCYSHTSAAPLLYKPKRGRDWGEAEERGGEGCFSVFFFAVIISAFLLLLNMILNIMKNSKMLNVSSSGIYVNRKQCHMFSHKTYLCLNGAFGHNFFVVVQQIHCVLYPQVGWSTARDYYTFLWSPMPEKYEPGSPVHRTVVFQGTHIHNHTYYVNHSVDSGYSKVTPPFYSIYKNHCFYLTTAIGRLGP